MTKLVLILLVVTCLFALPQSAPAQTNPFNLALTNVPVVSTTGTTVGTLTGTLNLVHFFNQQGQLSAAGLLNGTITNTLTGAVTQLVNQLVTVPITSATATCPILTLNVGPIHLDLLGLVVDTSAINVNITAQQGPGNLLGNLLCAVANLLNGSGPLGSLSGLLNNILRILG